MNRLAEILRAKRKELNLTPEEIAKRIGKSKRSYLYYEDSTQPKHDVLQKLAQVLQFDVAEVYESDGEKPEKIGETVSQKDISIPVLENVQKELGEVAKGGEMTSMFLMLIEHLQTISASLSETREIARENNSLVRTVLLNQSKSLMYDETDGAERRFQASLEVAKTILRQTFSHT